MQAFEIIDDRAVPCEYRGISFRRHKSPLPAFNINAPDYFTKREWRAKARKNTRGRRGAKCLGDDRRCFLFETIEYEVFEGHRLRRGKDDYIVYLPEGIKVTDDVQQAVEATVTGDTRPTAKEIAKVLAPLSGHRFALFGPSLAAREWYGIAECFRRAGIEVFEDVDGLYVSGWKITFNITTFAFDVARR